MKKKAQITMILSAAAFAASLCTLVSAAAYQPTSADTSLIENSTSQIQPIDETSSEQFTAKIIKIYDGHVAVFEENSNTPLKILETSADDLPKETVNQLKQGIIATTRDEYISYLEDFS